MKLHFVLPLLLALEQTVAFSTRNLQDMTNDTIIVDENFTKPIPMLFDAFLGNDTEFVNVSDSNGTFIIPASWLRGGLPANDTTFIKFAPFNDTFIAIPSDFNLTDFPPEIRFKNITEIMPNWRGGGDGNFTLIAMPSLSFDPNGTLPVLGVEGNLTLIAMPAIVPDFMTTSSENFTVFEDFVTTTSFDPNGTLPVLGVEEGNLTVIAMPAVLPDVIPTSSENFTVVEDFVTTTSFDPNGTLPVLGVGVPSTVDTPLITEVVGELSNTTAVASQVPLWLSLVKKLFNEDDLKLCTRRKNVSPVTGEKCSKRKDKTCYFGKKVCPGVAEYPETRCKCGGPKSNRTWTCVATTCP